jgi:hypothetical protein
LYGASGHKFNPPAQDILWIATVILSLTIMTIYLRAKTKKGVAYNILKILVGLLLIATFYFGLNVFLSIVDFNYGDDVSIAIIGLSYVLPLTFIGANAIFFISLIRTLNEKN